jgi:hypothetical protein
MEFRRCTRAVGLPAPGSRVEDATPFAGIAIGCYPNLRRFNHPLLANQCFS